MDEKRWNFTLRDVFVAVLALAILFAIGARWLGIEREKYREVACVHLSKQLGFAVQNHHDVFRCFPALSRREPPNDLNLATSSDSYSWTVRALPFIEETVLYNNLSQASGKFTSPASTILANVNGLPIWAVQVPGLRCPAYDGPSFATASEYTLRSGINKAGIAYGLAVSNYAALTASHIDNAIAEPFSTNPDGPNGVIVRTRGITMKDITDGVSKTFMICESRDSVYSNWYDGDVGWFVAADPNGPTPAKDSNNQWVATGGASVQLGPERQTPSAFYLAKGTLPTMNDTRSWGPSSQHLSGNVNHIRVDGSVQPVTAAIDPTLYMRLTTRSSGESVKFP
jgi:hypothetical protein